MPQPGPWRIGSKERVLGPVWTEYTSQLKRMRETTQQVVGKRKADLKEKGLFRRQKPMLAALEEEVMRNTETRPLSPALPEDIVPSFQMESEVSSRTPWGMNQATLLT